MGRQTRNQEIPCNDLLNFQYRTPAASLAQDFSSGRPNNSNARNNRRKNQQYNRTAQDRASARRKANSAMFYLHSSAVHSFGLTRRSSSKVNVEAYSFSGCDFPVSWESVRMVKQVVHLIFGIREDQTACPICLCDFVCARITRCGHSYCAGCILRHDQSHIASNPYTACQCPCCGIPVIVEDLRPVVIETLISPAVKHRIKLVKLHREKGCSAPYFPLPDAPKRANPNTAPCQSDPDAKYSRFNYVDRTQYRSLLITNQEEIKREMHSMSANSTEHTFLTMALDMVSKQLAKAQDEQNDEQTLQERFKLPTSGMYQNQSSSFVARVSYYETYDENSGGSGTKRDPSESEGSMHGIRGKPVSPQASFDSARAANHCPSLCQPDSLDSSPSIARHHRGDAGGSQKALDSPPTKSFGKEESVRPIPKKKSISQQICGGSMYCDGSSDVVLYQAEDGQLVFMNGFNMVCLLKDFSKTCPTDSSQLPLPDCIEGSILDLENVQLTPEVRKRMPFLGHLPLYTDVTLVELDLHHVLSEDTKNRLKAEFSKRRKRRQSKVQSERMADSAARKEEAERINIQKARVQMVDPEDDFFQILAETEAEFPLTGEDFGPALRSSHAERIHLESNGSEVVSGVSFSQACQRSHTPVMVSSETFPVLGSILPPPNRPARGSVGPSWVEQASGSHQAKEKRSPGRRKKRGKGQKVVLFTTSSQRGSVD